MTNRIRNTSAADALDHLIVAASPGGIEAQEAAGQRELVSSTVLPRVNHVSGDGRGDAEFEALGFTFGEMADGDDLFREATLPPGWTREGSDHAMWSYILDERGIRRVGVFYKAAFYDRSAHMSLLNVGYAVAQDFIYGDAAEPVIPEGLTPAEIAATKAAVEQYASDAERHPDIYGDRLPRAWRVFGALPA